jgi:hypothetical protein
MIPLAYHHHYFIKKNRTNYLQVPSKTTIFELINDQFNYLKTKKMTEQEIKEAVAEATATARGIEEAEREQINEIAREARDIEQGVEVEGKSVSLEV